MSLQQRDVVARCLPLLPAPDAVALVWACSTRGAALPREGAAALYSVLEGAASTEVAAPSSDVPPRRLAAEVSALADQGFDGSMLPAAYMRGLLCALSEPAPAGGQLVANSLDTATQLTVLCKLAAQQQWAPLTAGLPAWPRLASSLLSDCLGAAGFSSSEWGQLMTAVQLLCEVHAYTPPSRWASWQAWCLPGCLSWPDGVGVMP